GVNHLDIAPRYGAAEDLVGPLLPAVRDRLFVGCKTTRGNPDGVRAQLETSLTKLGCERLDLYQLHAVTDLDELERRVDAAAAIRPRGTSRGPSRTRSSAACASRCRCPACTPSARPATCRSSSACWRWRRRSRRWATASAVPHPPPWPTRPSSSRCRAHRRR